MLQKIKEMRRKEKLFYLRNVTSNGERKKRRDMNNERHQKWTTRKGDMNCERLLYYLSALFIRVLFFFFKF